MPILLTRTLSSTDLQSLSWSPQLAEKLHYRKRRYQASNYTKRPDVRQRILTRDNQQCCKCRGTANLTIDHIISVYQGGGDEDSNLQTLCNKCNAGKVS